MAHYAIRADLMDGSIEETAASKEAAARFSSCRPAVGAPRPEAAGREGWWDPHTSRPAGNLGAGGMPVLPEDPVQARGRSASAAPKRCWRRT
jgi:hypothetical protein